MKTAFDARRTINGTYGSMFLNGERKAEVTKLEMKVAFDKEDVNQCQQLISGSKITGAKITGTVSFTKVDSGLNVLAAEGLQTGKFPSHTIISNLADPDAYGAERVKVTGVTFDEFTLAEWEAKKIGEGSLPFTATGFEFMDIIEAV